MKRLASLLLAVCVVCFTSALAQQAGRGEPEEQHHHHDTEQLGTVSFPTSCAPVAQKSFERGVALLHSFEYDYAEKQFEEVAQKDPACAMAHWGIAMSLYHQLWERPPEGSLKRGALEIAKARSLKAKTARERGFIEALGAFYDDPATDHQVRAKAYCDAMEKVSKQNPNDHEAAAFYALSLLSSAPPNDTTFENAKKAIAILDPLFAKYPNHPGLAHYIIHASDRPQLAALGLAAARRYAAIAPSSAHALHMPSHIFARLGLWQEDIKSNRASIAATNQTMAMHMGGADHQLHAADFLVYALLQVGDDQEAEKWVKEEPQVAEHHRHSEHRDAPAWIGDRYDMHFPALLALETHRWSDAAALSVNPKADPQFLTETYWARTIGAARLGDAAAARQNAGEYEALTEKMRNSKNAYMLQYFDVERDQVQAWADFAEKKNDAALRRMREAADRQDARGKGEVDLPAREMLADMLLELDRPQEALAEYEKSLKTDPNRFNSLYGAARSAELAKMPEKSNSYYAALVKQCAGSHSDRPELSRARTMLAKK